jgi:hypothetical protein
MQLHIKLRQDETGYPPFSAEEVAATEVGDHQYRLESTPAFAFGLAQGDIVRAQHYGPELWVEELLQSSGHGTVRVVALGAHSMETPRVALEEMGCSVSPTVIDGMIAVDVPPHIDFNPVEEFLRSGRETSSWDFNIGVRAN